MAPEKIVKTTCQACDQSCGILCYVKDGKIVKYDASLQEGNIMVVA